MKLPGPLREAVLLRRYKRFLADVETTEGERLTLHCPNTGSMKNCQEPGSRVWYSWSDNPKRKYPGTWQLLERSDGDLVGINTGLANHLVREAIERGVVTELAGYKGLRREVAYGESGRSRIDLLLEDHPEAPDCHVEVKNVSLGEAGAVGLFPDAVTARGQKHLRELMQVSAEGGRAVLFFCVQHTGIDELRPADRIDPEYGRLLREAAAAGVELLAWRARFDVEEAEVKLVEPLPVRLPGL